MNAILTMSSFIFPLITFPYISRVLMPEGLGKVSFATSLVSYFSMFAQLGIPIYGVKACAKVKDDTQALTRVAQELLLINCVTGLLSYISLFCSVFLIPRLQEEKLLYILIGSTILFNAIGMEWFYKALEQYTYITARSILFKFIALIAMFILVHEKEDYAVYGALTIFAASASNILNLINVRKYISLKPIKGYRFSRHVKSILIFFAMSCATTVYTHLDTVMLGFIKTDMDVGYYNAAIKIKSVLVAITTSLGTVLLPRASYYIEHKRLNEFYRIGARAINFVLLTALPLMAYFIIFAHESIWFLSGSAFENATLPMQIIMPTILFIGLSNVLGLQMLVPLERDISFLISSIAGAIVDFILNWILIPRYGAAGAAIGTVAAEFTVLLVQYVALQKELQIITKELNCVRIITAVVFSSILAIGIHYMQASVFVRLALSAVIYYGSYIAQLLVFREPMMVEIKDMTLSRIEKIIHPRA